MTHTCCFDHRVVAEEMQGDLAGHCTFLASFPKVPTLSFLSNSLSDERECCFDHRIVAVAMHFFSCTTCAIDSSSLLCGYFLLN